MRKTLWIVIALLAMVALAAPAQADIVVLTDLNSTVSVNTGTQAGMDNWTVNGVDQMYQQWFWYRVGNQGPEASIDTLRQVGAIATNTNFNPGDDVLNVRYDNADPNTGLGATFQIDLRYSLQGALLGGGSDIGEQIKITNLSSSALDFHFFQYSDFDLNGQVGGQTVQLVNVNKVVQTGAGVQMSETVITPDPNYYSMNLFATTLNQLNDGVATTLNGPASAGPGDATWAFQWDFGIGVGGDAQISKDKLLRVVPEPGSMLLLGSGLIGLAGAVRRRLKK